MPTTIDRNDLATRLLQLPYDLADAEMRLFACQRITGRCREDLAGREAGFLLTGVPGKNAEERGAYLRLETATERLALQQAQEEEQLAALLVKKLRDESSCLRAVARLLAGDERN